MLEHQLCNSKVGDHAILHRADHGDAARRAPHHLLGGKAHLLHHPFAIRPALLAYRDH
jgi:hypothetical protein